MMSRAKRQPLGRLKLIDVDGCVPAGSEISIQAGPTDADHC
jgi:hypothetical protein